MPLGFGLSLNPRRAAAVWSPLSLFAAGEQGGWYDPTDLTTMFQDSAGTTPVTAVEQPVGRWLDKSGRSNHLIQPTSASRPTYSKRYNLLQRTEDFSNAVWQPANASKSGTTTLTLTDNATAGPHLIECTPLSDALAASTSYTVVAEVQAGTQSHITLGIARASSAASAAVEISTITWALTRFNAVGTGWAAGTPTIEDIGGGWRRITVTLTAGSTAGTESRGFFGLSDGVGAFDGRSRVSYTGTGTTAIFRRLDLRRTIHAQMGMPAYQRVTTATDYDETGFLPRLRFDGADDSMYSAASVNFSATDEMTVLTGLTKLSDAAIGIVAELSVNFNSENGSFYVAAPELTGASGNFSSNLRGSTAPAGAITSGTTLAPAGRVLTVLSEINPSVRTMRVNSVETALSAQSQGTGNFGNHVLFVGRRNNASLPFNGDIFQLIVRGALTSGAALTSAEQYVAARTGVTL